MNYKMIGYLLGFIMLIEAALLILPLIVAIVYGESLWPFIITILILTLASIPLIYKKPERTRIYAKDGFICVALSWLVLSGFGALPFVISGDIPNYIDALFETVSGFTTTGGSIIPNVEALTYSGLFWRSFTHWIGGMGVLMFMLAIIPAADGNGNSIYLLRAEVPGPTKGKIVPKLRTTALILYVIYSALTVIEIILLLITGMPIYDSIVNSLATAGTGGFATKAISIAGYANPAAEWIIAIFMMLFGVNFNLYFCILIGRAKDILKNIELRIYLIIITLSTIIICINTASMFDSVGDSIRSSFFQVTSIMSTTGFSTVDFNLWPSLSKAVLVLLMFIGGCAGSTAGGLKLQRIIILIKNQLREIKHLLKPTSVNTLKIDGEPVEESTIKSSQNYLVMYMVILLCSALLISIDGFDFETNATAVIACFNNIGPGLAKVGPMGNFAFYSIFSKIILIIDMLLGRLEIIPMVVILFPILSKKK